MAAPHPPPHLDHHPPPPPHVLHPQQQQHSAQQHLAAYQVAPQFGGANGAPPGPAGYAYSKPPPPPPGMQFPGGEYYPGYGPPHSQPPPHPHAEAINPNRPLSAQDKQQQQQQHQVIPGRRTPHYAPSNGMPPGMAHLQAQPPPPPQPYPSHQAPPPMYGQPPPPAGMYPMVAPPPPPYGHHQQFVPSGYPTQPPEAKKMRLGEAEPMGGVDGGAPAPPSYPSKHPFGVQGPPPPPTAPPPSNASQRQSPIANRVGEDSWDGSNGSQGSNASSSKRERNRESKDSNKKKRKRCGTCPGCELKDNCGECGPCKSVRSHQICKMRKCDQLKTKKDRIRETKQPTGSGSEYGKSPSDRQPSKPPPSKQSHQPGPPPPSSAPPYGHPMYPDPHSQANGYGYGPPPQPAQVPLPAQQPPPQQQQQQQQAPPAPPLVHPAPNGTSPYGNNNPNETSAQLPTTRRPSLTNGTQMMPPNGCEQDGGPNDNNRHQLMNNRLKTLIQSRQQNQKDVPTTGGQYSPSNNSQSFSNQSFAQSMTPPTQSSNTTPTSPSQQQQQQHSTIEASSPNWPQHQVPQPTQPPPDKSPTQRQQTSKQGGRKTPVYSPNVSLNSSPPVTAAGETFGSTTFYQNGTQNGTPNAYNNNNETKTLNGNVAPAYPAGNNQQQQQQFGQINSVVAGDKNGTEFSPSPHHQVPPSSGGDYHHSIAKTDALKTRVFGDNFNALSNKNGTVEMQMINKNSSNDKIDHFLVNTTTAVQHLSTLTTSMSTSTDITNTFSAYQTVANAQGYFGNNNNTTGFFKTGGDVMYSSNSINTSAGVSPMTEMAGHHQGAQLSASMACGRNNANSYNNNNTELLLSDDPQQQQLVYLESPGRPASGSAEFYDTGLSTTAKLLVSSSALRSPLPTGLSPGHRITPLGSIGSLNSPSLYAPGSATSPDSMLGGNVNSMGQTVCLPPVSSFVFPNFRSSSMSMAIENSAGDWFSGNDSRHSSLGGGGGIGGDGSSLETSPLSHLEDHTKLVSPSGGDFYPSDLDFYGVLNGGGNDYSMTAAL